MMKRRGRKPLIAIKIQIDLFKKYHEQLLQKSYLKYNNPIFSIMSKEIDAKMSPKALYMSYIRNYAHSAYSEARTSEDTLKIGSTNISTPIADEKTVSIAQQKIMFTFMKANEDFGKCQIKEPNIFGLDAMENAHEVETWQDKKSMARKRGRQLQMDDVNDSKVPPLQEQLQINVSAPETYEAGPSKSLETGIIEDVIQASSIIKMELDSSDSDDPLNFEGKQISSDTPTPEPKPEPEIEQPATPATNPPRRKRIRRVIRRPITRSKLDNINRMTVNELRKALTQKNEIRKQFYAEYLVEVRKQTEALVAIAKKLTDR